MLFVFILQVIALGFLSASIILDELMLSLKDGRGKCPVTIHLQRYNETINLPVSVRDLRVEWGYTSVRGLLNDLPEGFGDVSYTQTYKHLHKQICGKSSHKTNSSQTTSQPTPKPTSKLTSNSLNALNPFNSIHTFSRRLTDQFQSSISLTDSYNSYTPNTLNSADILDIIFNNSNLTQTVILIDNNNNYIGNISNSTVDIPTPSPSVRPTLSPTEFPTVKAELVTNPPTQSPTHFPTVTGNLRSTAPPTKTPTNIPSMAPTNLPTVTVYVQTDAPTTAPTPSLKNGCDDLKVVIITGESYFGLIIGGLCLVLLSMIGSVINTCQLTFIENRRIIRQIVIVLNIVSFMALMLAFALWIGFFSSNINSILEGNENSIEYCILGNPNMGLSVIFLIVSWVLIGFVSIIACYCGNRPHRWYHYLRRVRHGVDSNDNNNNMTGVIDVNSNDIQSNMINKHYSRGMKNRYLNQQPNPIGLYGGNIDNIPVDSMQLLYDDTEQTRTQTNTYPDRDDDDDDDDNGGGVNIVYGQSIERQYGAPSHMSSNGSFDGKSSHSASVAGVGASIGSSNMSNMSNNINNNYDYEYGNNNNAYGRSTRHRRRGGYKRGMMDDVHPQYSPLLN